MRNIKRPLDTYCLKIRLRPYQLNFERLTAKLPFFKTLIIKLYHLFIRLELNVTLLVVRKRSKSASEKLKKKTLIICYTSRFALPSEPSDT